MTLPIGSYSFYNKLQTCPHQAQHIHVLKDIPYVESPEMKWGNEVHKALEDRIGKGVPLPETMVAAEPLANTFAKLAAQLTLRVEFQLGMTVDGAPCDYWDKERAWFRGKLDCVVMGDSAAWLVDWKTGNPREEPFELECGALLLKAIFPKLEMIVGEYFWMKTGQKGIRYTFNSPGVTFGRLQALRAEAEGYERAGGDWPKRKGPLCGWCGVLSCEHNKKGRK